MMRYVPILGLATALVLGTHSPSQAVNLGTCTGQTFDVPQAKCHPHCQIREGGNVEGDSYQYIDSFPANALLDADTAVVHCVGTGCPFDQTSVTINNLEHKANLSILSRSEPVKIYFTAKIVDISK